MPELPLNPYWKSLGARFAAEGTWNVPANFGDVKAEYLAAKDTALIDFSWRAKIKVTGGDRILVLHRLLTNDIKSLGPGRACPAAFLTAQGKVVAVMDVYVFADHVLLDAEAGLGKKIIDRLGALIITEDAALAEAEDLAHLGLWGQNAEARARASGLAFFRRDLPEGPAFDLFVPAAGAEAAAKRLVNAGARPCGVDAYEMLRIEKGLLRYGRDITEDMTLPETGLDRISASETKGCYPGQEVVARTNTYHGHAKKIVRVEFEKSAGAAAGDKFFVEGKEAGWLTSVSGPPSAEKGRGLGYALKGYFDAPLDVRIGAAAAKGRIFPD